MRRTDSSEDRDGEETGDHWNGTEEVERPGGTGHGPEFEEVSWADAGMNAGIDVDLGTVG